jgi:tetratricopeptide (TPR) repeat protein
MDEAKKLLDLAATKAVAANDVDAEARARSMLAPLLVDAGDAEAGRDAARAAVQLFSSLSDLVGLSEVAFTLARADLALADFAAAVEDCVHGIEHAQAIGDRSREGNLRWIEAVARFNLGQASEAFAAAESGFELFTQSGDEASAAGICFVRGELAKAAGDIDGARSWMTRSAEAWRAFGDERRAAWCEEAIEQLERAS